MGSETTKKRAAKAAPVASVDDYLAGAPEAQRVALKRLRATIRKAAPDATERMAYGMAGYKYRGRPLVHFAYWKDHLALYGSFDAHASELEAYDLDKGTIRFSADKPLPDRLVAQIVKARVEEIERNG